MTNVRTITLGIPNGVIFISDATGGQIPIPVRGALFGSTRSCISVACEIDSEGATALTLGSINDVGPDFDPTFEHDIDITTRSVGVFVVPGREILNVPLGGGRARVRVWTNRARQADKVIIGVDAI